MRNEQQLCIEVHLVEVGIDDNTNGLNFGEKKNEMRIFLNQHFKLRYILQIQQNQAIFLNMIVYQICNFQKDESTKIQGI